MADYTPAQCADIKNRYCKLECHLDDVEECDDLIDEWDIWLKGYKNCGSLYGALGITQCNQDRYRLLDKYGLVSIKNKSDKIDEVNRTLAMLDGVEVLYDMGEYHNYIASTVNILLRLFNDYTLNLNIHELDGLRLKYEDKYHMMLLTLYPSINEELETLTSDEIYERLLDVLSPDAMQCLPSSPLETRTRMLQILWICYRLVEINGIDLDVFDTLLTGNICMTGQNIRLFMLLCNILYKIYRQ